MPSDAFVKTPAMKKGTTSTPTHKDSGISTPKSLPNDTKKHSRVGPMSSSSQGQQDPSIVSLDNVGQYMKPDKSWTAIDYDIISHGTSVPKPTMTHNEIVQGIKDRYPFFKSKDGSRLVNISSRNPLYKPHPAFYKIKGRTEANPGILTVGSPHPPDPSGGAPSDASRLCQLVKDVKFFSPMSKQDINRTTSAKAQEDEWNCICSGTSDQEDWVHCDNPDCPIGWYHLWCGGIDKAPPGKWFCQRCNPNPRLSDRRVSFSGAPLFPNLDPSTKGKLQVDPRKRGRPSVHWKPGWKGYVEPQLEDIEHPQEIELNAGADWKSPEPRSTDDQRALMWENNQRLLMSDRSNHADGEGSEPHNQTSGLNFNYEADEEQIVVAALSAEHEAQQLRHNRHKSREELESMGDVEVGQELGSGNELSKANGEDAENVALLNDAFSKSQISSDESRSQSASRSKFLQIKGGDQISDDADVPPSEHGKDAQEGDPDGPSQIDEQHDNTGGNSKETGYESLYAQFRSAFAPVNIKPQSLDASRLEFEPRRGSRRRRPTAWAKDDHEEEDSDATISDDTSPDEHMKTTTKKSAVDKRAWESPEKSAVHLLMGEILDEQENHDTEQKWKVISDRLMARYSMDRSPLAVKNYWCRYGRSATGVDERRRPDADRMVTGYMNPAVRRRSRALRRLAAANTTNAEKHLIVSIPYTKTSTGAILNALAIPEYEDFPSDQGQNDDDDNAEMAEVEDLEAHYIDHDPPTPYGGLSEHYSDNERGESSPNAGGIEHGKTMLASMSSKEQNHADQEAQDGFSRLSIQERHHEGPSEDQDDSDSDVPLASRSAMRNKRMTFFSSYNQQFDRLKEAQIDDAMEEQGDDDEDAIVVTPLRSQGKKYRISPSPDEPSVHEEQDMSKDLDQMEIHEEDDDDDSIIATPHRSERKRHRVPSSSEESSADEEPQESQHTPPTHLGEFDNPPISSNTRLSLSRRQDSVEISGPRYPRRSVTKKPRIAISLSSEDSPVEEESLPNDPGVENADHQDPKKDHFSDEEVKLEHDSDEEVEDGAYIADHPGSRVDTPEWVTTSASSEASVATEPPNEDAMSIDARHSADEWLTTSSSSRRSSINQPFDDDDIALNEDESISESHNAPFLTDGGNDAPDIVTQESPSATLSTFHPTEVQPSIEQGNDDDAMFLCSQHSMREDNVILEVDANSVSDQHMNTFQPNEHRNSRGLRHSLLQDDMMGFSSDSPIPTGEHATANKDHSLPTTQNDEAELDGVELSMMVDSQLQQDSTAAATADNDAIKIESGEEDCSDDEAWATPLDGRSPAR